ncbi:MAG: glycosyltransferase [Candidatus Saccharibacteria bacterium]|nr:glycosyltransferase [Moraxellaceae bacterium]
MILSQPIVTAASVEELLSYHDEIFIRVAYQTLLHRPADPSGTRYYLARLQTGVSKKEIISQIATSVEAQSKRVNVAGLDLIIKNHEKFKTSWLKQIYHRLITKKNRMDNAKKQISTFEDKNYQTGLHPSFDTTATSMTLAESDNITPIKIEEKMKKNDSNYTLTSTLDKKDILFDTDWYLEQNPDVAESGIDPYTHYINYGKKEGRHPRFDKHWYLNQYTDVVDNGIDAHEHYIHYGKFEGRHPAFDGDWYLDQYPDVAASGSNPLDHYLRYGKAEGRHPAYSVYTVDRNNYSKWVLNFDTINDKNRESMKIKSNLFKNKPLISVVMPVYNPNLVWLAEAIESIQNQIYPNWELCIADDLSPNPAIRQLLEQYAKKDSRVKVVFRTENGHISNATNSALEISSGEWIALLDHDDMLPQHALFWVVEAINTNPNIRMIYSDEDKMDEKGNRSSPYFKCDWNPDLFYSHNMFSHLGVYHSALVREVGGFRVGMEGSQDYDLALRCSEKIQLKQIHHVPRVLYHWRIHAESTASSADAKPYAMIAGERAINEHFQRRGVNAKAELIVYGYRVRYALPKILPLVTLIIPTRNGLKLLQQCVESIIEKTTYTNYEILIIDNGSDDTLTLRYLKKIVSNPSIRVVRDDGPFNYSALNNSAVKIAKGEIVGLINNDIEVISPEWLSEMVSHALRPEVGAVGAKLLYPNNTIQHAGILLGVTGIAAHAHRNIPRDQHGYFGRASLLQSFSAVTAACLLVRKSLYESIGGLNAIDLKVAFNDVDFCIRLRDAGYRNIFTPYAELYHHESATRGSEESPENIVRFAKEVDYMKKNKSLSPDPAYSPNLTIDNDDFSLANPPRVVSIN